MESQRYNEAYEYLHHIDDLIEDGYIDRMMRLEADFNETIDECVQYGSFSQDEGEAYKKRHHELLWQRLGKRAIDEEE